MTKRRPSFTIKGDRGEVTVRCWGNGYRIKATAYDGDAAVEALLAAHTISLMQEVTRSVAGDPDMRLHLASLRHIDDHPTPKVRHPEEA